jgi:hypothetical protein
MTGRSEQDPVAAIRALYFRTTAATIERDLRRAIALFKTLRADAERERAAVFMDGLSQLRSEWAARRRKPRDRQAR